ncbi:MAG: rRNA maturation RNase YbeY [Chloroflexota bacterium]
MFIINIHIEDNHHIDIDQNRLTTVVENTLQICNTAQGELTISITSDAAIQVLNHQYRGFDKPTDVLSFEAEATDNSFVIPDEVATYLGDIIISAETAARQAAASDHAPFEEILLLAIHGTLHLLGFDHMTVEEKAEMWKRQNQMLQLHDLAHVTPTE